MQAAGVCSQGRIHVPVGSGASSHDGGCRSGSCARTRGCGPPACRDCRAAHTTGKPASVPKRGTSGTVPRCTSSPHCRAIRTASRGACRSRRPCRHRIHRPKSRSMRSSLAPSTPRSPARKSRSHTRTRSKSSSPSACPGAPPSGEPVSG